MTAPIVSFSASVRRGGTRSAAVLSALSLVGLPCVSRAAISGFGDFSNFTFNQSDSSAGPTISGSTLHLTNSAAGEVRSVFDDTPQSIAQFNASFGFRAAGAPSNVSTFGACLVIQNEGVNQVATNDEGIQGTYGYQNWRDVFGRSIAVSLEYGSVGANSSATALYTGGQLGGGAGTTSPVNVFNGDLMNVSLTYNGSILRETVLDTATNASFSQSYVVNIPAAVGGQTAFIGFTANTANTSGAMDFSNLQFSTAVPEPASIGLVASGLIGCLRRRRRV